MVIDGVFIRGCFMKNKSLKNIPVVGQAHDITDTVKKVSNITDLVQAAVTAVEMIIEDCLPPQIKYPLGCALLFRECGIVIYSLVTIQATVSFSLFLCIGAAK